MLLQRQKSYGNEQPAATVRGDRGSALIIALLMIFAVAAIGAVLAMMSTFDTRISSNQETSTKALYVAEAGLNEAAHRLSLHYPTIDSLSGWTGNVAIADTPPYDPNWKTRIYMTPLGGEPPASGSEVHTGTLQDLSGDYFKYSAVSGTEDVLTIQHKWEDLNGDGVRDAGEIVRYDANKIPPENFTTGEPIEVIDVTGQVNNGKRSIQAEVTRLPITGRTLGALFVDKAIQVKGTPALCGFNHSLAIPNETAPNACLAYHMAGGGLPGLTTTGDEITYSGAAWEILGEPAPTDTSSSNPFPTLAEALGISDSQLEQLLLQADNTSVVNPLNGITYLDGDATINDDIVGEGLVYITGDFKGNGDFIYRGLIYVEGDLQFTGNPWILGCLICKGEADWSVSAGNAVIVYSEDAIKRILSEYLPMVTLSWREK